MRHNNVSLLTCQDTSILGLPVRNLTFDFSRVLHALMSRPDIPDAGALRGKKVGVSSFGDLAAQCKRRSDYNKLRLRLTQNHKPGTRNYFSASCAREKSKTRSSATVSLTRNASLAVSRISRAASAFKIPVKEIT